MNVDSQTAVEAEAYQAWLRQKVAASLADQTPVVPHKEALATARKTIETRRSA